MNLQDKRIAIVTLGCKVNQYETDAICTMLKDAGAIMVDPHEYVDIYMVNTCSVTNMAERKSRQMLHRARKHNENVIVVALGCYAQVGKEELIKDQQIQLVIGNNKKKDLVKILSAYEPHANGQEEVIDLNGERPYENLQIGTLNGHTRAYIKVQDGCNQFCSYCIIPYARGRVRSREFGEIKEEITRLCQKGCKEFVITGIHIASYGKDLDDGTLIELIEQIAEINGVKRIRLGSLEPCFVTEDTARRLANIQSFCPHFHLSIQSGCDETLKRMNRKYSAGDVKEKCRILRKYFDNPAITTDIIVGFPGETEEEFAKTKEFLEEVNLYEMHIFKYSIRQGTVAATMENQVDESIKTKRSNLLLALAKKNQQAYEESKQSKVLEVLVEECDHKDEGCMVGHTKEYIKVAFPGDESMINQIYHVKLKATTNRGCMDSEIVKNIC